MRHFNRGRLRDWAAVKSALAMHVSRQRVAAKIESPPESTHSPSVSTPGLRNYSSHDRQLWQNDRLRGFYDHAAHTPAKAGVREASAGKLPSSLKSVHKSSVGIQKGEALVDYEAIVTKRPVCNSPRGEDTVKWILVEDSKKKTSPVVNTNHQHRRREKEKERENRVLHFQTPPADMPHYLRQQQEEELYQLHPDMRPLPPPKETAIGTSNGSYGSPFMASTGHSPLGLSPQQFSKAATPMGNGNGNGRGNGSAKKKTFLSSWDEFALSDALMAQSGEMQRIMRGRHQSIKVIRALWNQGGAEQGIERLIRMNDPAVLHDCLSLIACNNTFHASSHFTLSFCVALLPGALLLLSQPYEDWIHTALECLSSIYRGFGNLILTECPGHLRQPHSTPPPLHSHRALQCGRLVEGLVEAAEACHHLSLHVSSMNASLAVSLRSFNQVAEALIQSLGGSLPSG